MELSAKSLISSAVRNLGVKVVAIPAGFLVGVVLARVLGAEEYGKYAYILSFATLAVSGLIRVSAVFLVREIAASLRVNSKTELLGSIVTYIIFSIPCLLVMLMVVSLLIPQDQVSNLDLSLLILLLFLLGSISGVYRGFGRTALGLFVEQAARPFFQLLILLVVVYWLKVFDLDSANEAIRTLLFGGGLALSLGLLGVPFFLKTIDDAKPIFKKEWFLSALPVLLLLGYSQGLTAQLPTLLLANLSENSEVAMYRVALNLAGLISLVLLVVNVALGPRLAAAKAKNQVELFEHLLRVASTLAIIVALPATLFFFLLGDRLIPFFYGPEYLASLNVFYVLCVAQMINCLCGPILLAFNMLKKEQMSLLAIFFGISLSTISCLVLIPEYGAIGAASGALIGLTGWNLLLAILLYFKEGILCLPYYKLKHFDYSEEV